MWAGPGVFVLFRSLPITMWLFFLFVASFPVFARHIHVADEQREAEVWDLLPGDEVSLTEEEWTRTCDSHASSVTPQASAV